MPRFLGAYTLAALIASTLGCSGDAASDIFCDGGFCPVSPSNDAGPGAAPATDFDGPTTCQELLVKACGGSPEGDTPCARGPGCEAAQLLAELAPERCEGALDDPDAYPPCEETACERLVDKVCPPDGTADSDCDGPCALARSLEEDANEAADSDLRDEAAAACAAGLEDSALFPRCSM